MNFPLNTLTSIENLNLFSTPKFRDIHLDKNNTNKSNIIQFEPISKNSPTFYGTKNQLHKNNINSDKKIDNNNNENSDKNNKPEVFLKENFSLSSLNNTSNTIDKASITKAILDIKINKNQKKDKNIALISFCDKSDNYSFNNYSYSTNKDKQEININNNKNLQKEMNYKESEMQSQSNKSNNSNSNSNGNNSTSFKYNLPLENDKIPLINNFISYQDSNNILDAKNNKNNETKENNSLGLDNNKEKISNNGLKENESIKEDLICQNKENIIIKDKNLSEKRCLTEKKSKIDKIMNEELNFKNNSATQKIKKNMKNLINKKNILYRDDNNKKIKKKIKISTINEIQNKFKIAKTEKTVKAENNSSGQINKIISPRKKFELMIKQIDINIGNNNETEENNNFNELYSFTTRESKIRNSMPIENNLNSHRNLKNNFYLKKNNNNIYINDNYSSDRISNTTNKLKKKNKRIIKSNNNQFDYNKTFFNFYRNENDILINKKSKGTDYKKINISLSKNFNKKEIKNLNKDSNKQYSFHTRNISNLYSNKIFNEVKNIINNNNKNFILNTINYETNDKNKKLQNINILQKQIRIKPHIKNLIQKTTNLKRPNDVNKSLQKGIHLSYLKSNNNSNYKNNIKNKFHTIVLDKNNKNKDNSNIQKKIKPKNILKNKISPFNRFKNFFINNKINKNNIKIENKNQSTNKLINIISGPSTDRANGENNNNIISTNIDNKSIIRDNIFINVNDSKYNKIKVNTINIPKKIHKSDLSSNFSNKTNSYWKIHKKPKNSCLLNNYNNEVNKKEETNINNKYHITIEGNSKNSLNVNSQILIFNKYRPTKFPNLDAFKEKIPQYNLTNSNSKSIMSESSYTDRNNYNSSINENLNIEITKNEIGNIIKKEKEKIHQYDTFYKIYKNKNNSFKNKLNQLSTKIHKSNNYNSKIQNFKEEILKYSILRNNQNNQIINEFSVVLGEEKEKNKINNSNKEEIKRSKNKSIENKKTIINVNQFYPSYYIETHEIVTK